MGPADSGGAPEPLLAKPALRSDTPPAPRTELAQRKFGGVAR